MADYITRDSGARAEYANGYVRDTDEGKPRFDLMIMKGVPYQDQPLYHEAMVYARGAVKYQPRNHERAYGFHNPDDDREEEARFEASMLRHVFQFLCGEEDERHDAQAIFNIRGLRMMRQGASAAEVRDALSDQEEAAQQTLSGGVVSSDSPNGGPMAMPHVEACGAVFSVDTENPCVLPGLPEHDDHVDRHGMRWYGDSRLAWEACAERHRRLDGVGYAACIRRQGHRGEHDHRTHMVNR